MPRTQQMFTDQQQCRRILDNDVVVAYEVAPDDPEDPDDDTSSGRTHEVFRVAVVHRR